MITKEKVFDLLVSAIEGGSNYWYLFDKEACQTIKSYEGECFVDRLWAALLDGRFIPVHDVIEEGKKLGELSLPSIEYAKLLIVDQYPYHYADIITENDDATTADVFFQLAVMKDVIYG